MTTNDPDQIRADIERTRANLSSDVDALTDEANPKNIAKRQANKVKDATIGVKDRIMGSASDAGDAVGDAASHVGDAVSGAPSAVRSKAQGNPLAAGLVAFGAGLLVASLFPPSEKEQHAASTVKERVEPLKEQATDIAKDAAAHLKEPAQQAAESVKDTATEAAQTVKDEGSSAAADVQDQAASSKQSVQEAQSGQDAPSGAQTWPTGQGNPSSR
ncbi:DUF3618 domain-containing protein [Microlunatus panaciterrae]|uniref:ElaB/YqjD/DUF883 family membrane-anchored ribosome-binding protein n=1 Tax=Microlunatus panaciterrae TaxID=400768 RepID=A0ABS2RRB2_9ACTN|nr:DUF3618 domain-containing protein [Microlunatus panaciterrae]MBM7800701.1 ElaB/YqjD/DUF883 family membrane-anchored ribosome-binding protein [Microlunatus panaciterrae]